MDILERSFEVLPDNEVLKEKALQGLLDQVYDTLNTSPIESHVIFKEGRFLQQKLVHRPKSVLLESLDIDSAMCIKESDVELYEKASEEERIGMEIPVNYKSIQFLDLPQNSTGHRPFIVSDKAYSDELGLQLELLR